LCTGWGICAVHIGEEPIDIILVYASELGRKITNLKIVMGGLQRSDQDNLQPNLMLGCE
jgi:hypothetical protein